MKACAVLGALLLATVLVAPASGQMDVVGSIVQALKDNDSNVRFNAALALGEIGDIRAVVPLIQALKDDDSFVLSNVAGALGKIGKSAAGPLV